MKGIKKPDHFDRSLQQQHQQLKGHSAHSIISTSSWRVGEELVQKQLGELKTTSSAQPTRRRQVTVAEAQSTAKRKSGGGTVKTTPTATMAKQRTDCYLIDSAGSQPPPARNSNKENRLNAASTDGRAQKTRPYDHETIHRFMQRQKLKRLKVQKTFLFKKFIFSQISPQI